VYYQGFQWAKLHYVFYLFQLTEVSQTGHHSVSVRRPVAVGLKFEAGIVAIQSHSLVEKHVIILALMTSPGNVTRSFVLVRIFCENHFGWLSCCCAVSRVVFFLYRVFSMKKHYLGLANASLREF
jgi:hypothetical protein